VKAKTMTSGDPSFSIASSFGGGSVVDDARENAREREETRGDGGNVCVGSIGRFPTALARDGRRGRVGRDFLEGRVVAVVGVGPRESST